MRKRTVKLWRLTEDGRKLSAGTIEAADPRELVLKWSAFLATAERGFTLPPTGAASWGRNQHSRLRPAPWQPRPSSSHGR
jgi:hypothetical protein